jgi:hypothetical protein
MRTTIFHPSISIFDQYNESYYLVKQNTYEIHSNKEYVFPMPLLRLKLWITQSSQLSFVEWSPSFVIEVPFNVIRGKMLAHVISTVYERNAFYRPAHH